MAEKCEDQLRDMGVKFVVCNPVFGVSVCVWFFWNETRTRKI